MAHAENPHRVPRDAVANDVGIGRNQFPQFGVWNQTPPLREIREAIPSRDQRFNHLPRGMRI